MIRISAPAACSGQFNRDRCRFAAADAKRRHAALAAVPLQGMDQGHDQARPARLGPLLCERSGRWVLLDYVDIVVHVQHTEEREFYALDRLWKDCPTIEFVDRDLPATSGAA